MTGNAGQIYAEYWVDCARCREAKPCGETNHRKVKSAAEAQGYRLIDDDWVYRSCQSDVEARQYTHAKAET